MLGDKNKIFLTLFSDLLLIIISIWGISQFINKADIPIRFSQSDKNLIVAKNNSNNNSISLSDTLVSIDGYNIATREELEVYLDSRSVSEKIELILNNFAAKKVEIKLTKFYSTFYIISAVIVGYLFILIGIFVFLKAPQKTSAEIFHWVSVLTGVIMLTTWGNYYADPKLLNILVRFIFHLAYLFVPVIFIHLALMFPNPLISKPLKIMAILYSAAAILAIVVNIAFAELCTNIAIEKIKTYIFYFDICRMFQAGGVIAALLIFVYKYFRTGSSTDGKKMKWIIFGLIVGPLPYIFLWVIPQGLTGNGFVPEELTLILLTAVPITFAISITKYHLWDIDYIINRSFVYGLVAAGLICVYMLVVYSVSLLLKQYKVDETIPSIFAILLIAIISSRFKNLVQEWVDKKFFRIKYNFRIAVKEFNEKMKFVNEIQNLADMIVENVQKIIPVNRIGFFRLDSQSNKIKLIAHKNFDILERRSIPFLKENLTLDLYKPVALAGKVEPEADVELAEREVFKRWGMDLVITLKLHGSGILGFIVLGEKKSQQKYSVEDIDLINSIGIITAEAIDRIELQKKLILKELEKKKLEELNDLKTFFISSAGHELKTPLASIKMFSELLQRKKNLTPEETEYLEIIEGESTRLSRQIDDLLDLSKIEKGMKEFDFKELNVNQIICSILKALSYQLKMSKCELLLNIPEAACFIEGDKDSFISAVTNLIVNAIKYSANPKQIILSIVPENGFVKVSIKDNGIGISAEDLKYILKPFYRANSGRDNKIIGTGIGLSLVDHIMRVHNGELKVESEEKKGSTFTLIFPKSNENINN